MIENKKDKDRDDIIDERFEQMLVRAREVNNDKKLVRFLADKKRYLRLCGEGYRTVSLKDETPLSGYGSSQYKDIESALNSFGEYEKKLCKPGRNVPECLLQCFLIRKALQNDRSLKNVMEGSMGAFDEILFALDEVSLGDRHHKNEQGEGAKRLDMLCVGQKGSEWHPLVIELKYRRQGEKLVKQVTEYTRELDAHRTRLDPLLEEITGHDVCGQSIEKMVIFPAPETDRPNKNVDATRKLFQGENIRLVEFHWKYSFSPA